MHCDKEKVKWVIPVIKKQLKTEDIQWQKTEARTQHTPLKVVSHVNPIWWADEHFFLGSEVQHWTAEACYLHVQWVFAFIHTKPPFKIQITVSRFRKILNMSCLKFTEMLRPWWEFNFIIMCFDWEYFWGVQCPLDQAELCMCSCFNITGNTGALGVTMKTIVSPSQETFYS